MSDDESDASESDWLNLDTDVAANEASPGRAGAESVIPSLGADDPSRPGPTVREELGKSVEAQRVTGRDDQAGAYERSTVRVPTEVPASAEAPLNHELGATMPSDDESTAAVDGEVQAPARQRDDLGSIVSRETRPEATIAPRADEAPLAAVSRETENSAGGSGAATMATSVLDGGLTHAEARGDQETPIARETARAIQVLNVRQERWPTPARTRIMTVANQKGGVGKTTSAVNVAAALALHGLQVLLIDLDPQGNASTALGIEHGVGTPSIYDVLLGGQPLAEVTQVADFAPSLRCVPATIDLAGADIELTSQVAREYRLQRALLTFLESGQADVDYVIIDCPPSLGLLTLNALVAAREVLLPIQCEYYALEGLAQLLKTVDLVTSHLNPELVVTTVLLTMYDSRTRLADQVADEVRRHFGDLVLEPTIPRNVRVSEAPGFGQTVITYDPGSRGAIGYVQAAHEIAVRGARGDHNVTEGDA